MSDLREFLIRAIEYFEDRADINSTGGANVAMQLQGEAEQLLGALESLRVVAEAQPQEKPALIQHKFVRGETLGPDVCHQIVRATTHSGCPTHRVCGEPEPAHVAEVAHIPRAAEPEPGEPLEQDEERCKCCGHIDCECVLGHVFGTDPQSGDYEDHGCVVHGRCV